MNSLASILYSSSSAKTSSKKRKNLSLQPSLKPTTRKPSRSKAGMLFRSSTPKTSLQPLTKTTITAHPTSSLSINSSQSPRCSTPLFAKQRRTRPFIACELCRQRAFQSLNEDENKSKLEKKNEKQQSYHPSLHGKYSLYKILITTTVEKVSVIDHTSVSSSFMSKNNECLLMKPTRDKMCTKKQREVNRYPHQNLY